MVVRGFSFLVESTHARSLGEKEEESRVVVVVEWSRAECGMRDAKG